MLYILVSICELFVRTAVSSTEFVSFSAWIAGENVLFSLLSGPNSVTFMHLNVPHDLNQTKNHWSVSYLCTSFCYFSCTDFGYKSPLIITKLAVIAIILWFLPPINSLIRTRQEAWKAIFTLIDDNKFVSPRY